MKRFSKATATTLAGAVTTALAALFPEHLGDPKMVGALGTILGALFVYFAPANKEI